MKTRNFIAVLVLMLGAFSMVIGQNKSYKVSTINSYVVNSNSLEPQLVKSHKVYKTAYINTEKAFISVPFPNRDYNVRLYIDSYEVKTDDKGLPMMYLSTHDKYSKECDVYFNPVSLTVSFIDNHTGFIFVYEIEEI